MKFIPFFLLLLPIQSLLAQPDFNSLQKDWIEKLDKDESYEDMMFDRGYLLYLNGRAYNNNDFYEKERTDINLKFAGYEHIRSFEHNESRYGTVGFLSRENQSFILFTGWRYVEDEWKKEIDIILIRSIQEEIGDEIDAALYSERREWVELANQHNPLAHVRESYTEDAVYFGYGMRSDGHEDIAKRYNYMENTDYQVDLEKRQLTKISDYLVLEVGRYFTGGERKGKGGLYTILWERQNDDEWEITLDFNF